MLRNRKKQLLTVNTPRSRVGSYKQIHTYKGLNTERDQNYELPALKGPTNGNNKIKKIFPRNLTFKPKMLKSTYAGKDKLYFTEIANLEVSKIHEEDSRVLSENDSLVEIISDIII